MNSENGLNGDMRILLADDHDMVRDTISAYLSSEGGAQITATTDLPRAMKELEDNGPFDLVLLDYNMPGMNGLDGLQRAHAAHHASKASNALCSEIVVPHF